jgi:hypothetical protein
MRDQVVPLCVCVDMSCASMIESTNLLYNCIQALAKASQAVKSPFGSDEV